MSSSTFTMVEGHPSTTISGGARWAVVAFLLGTLGTGVTAQDGASSKSGLSSGALAGVGIGSVGGAALLLAVACSWWLCVRRRRQAYNSYWANKGADLMEAGSAPNRGGSSELPAPPRSKRPQRHSASPRATHPKSHKDKDLQVSRSNRVDLSAEVELPAYAPAEPAESGPPLAKSSMLMRWLAGVDAPKEVQQELVERAAAAVAAGGGASRNHHNNRGGVSGIAFAKSPFADNLPLLSLAAQSGIVFNKMPPSVASSPAVSVTDGSMSRHLLIGSARRSDMPVDPATQDGDMYPASLGSASLLSYVPPDLPLFGRQQSERLSGGGTVGSGLAGVGAGVTLARVSLGRSSRGLPASRLAGEPKLVKSGSLSDEAALWAGVPDAAATAVASCGTATAAAAAAQLPVSYPSSIQLSAPQPLHPAPQLQQQQPAVQAQASPWAIAAVTAAEAQPQRVPMLHETPAVQLETLREEDEHEDQSFSALSGPMSFGRMSSRADSNIKPEVRISITNAYNEYMVGEPTESPDGGGQVALLPIPPASLMQARPPSSLVWDAEVVAAAAPTTGSATKLQQAGAAVQPLPAAAAFGWGYGADGGSAAFGAATAGASWAEVIQHASSANKQLPSKVGAEEQRPAIRPFLIGPAAGSDSSRAGSPKLPVPVQPFMQGVAGVDALGKPRSSYLSPSHLSPKGTPRCDAVPPELAARLPAAGAVS